MSIGPVQLMVLGFDRPDFRGEVLAELERLRANDMVRVIDSLVVQKDADGQVTVAGHMNNLTTDETVEFGTKIGALIGLGAGGIEGMETGAELGGAAAADGASVFSEDEAWDVVADIPNDTAAALILLEHHWAVPLRNAIFDAGGFPIADRFIRPLDLVGIGVMSVEEAAQPGLIKTVHVGAE